MSNYDVGYVAYVVYLPSTQHPTSLGLPRWETAGEAWDFAYSQRDVGKEVARVAKIHVRMVEERSVVYGVVAEPQAAVELTADQTLIAERVAEFINEAALIAEQTGEEYE